MKISLLIVRANEQGGCAVKRNGENFQEISLQT
jgi:hypothetical protein